MPEIIVKSVDYTEHYPLRVSVLSQHANPKPFDTALDSFHVGVFEDGKLVSIASIYHTPPPDGDDPGAWQLGGMATDPAAQGRGYGRLALERCVQYAVEQGGTLVWLDGREKALGFYRSVGFTVRDGGYDTGRGTGIHYFCWRKL
jgi:GNAT superfamily N-acetyltransferase